MKENKNNEKPKKKTKFKDKLNKISKNINKNLKLDEQRFSLLELILLIGVTFIFGIFISEAFIYDGNEKSKNKLSTNEIESIYNDIANNYYKDLNKEELKEAAIEGMLNYLGDNYSVYYDSAEADDFNEKLNGTYLGIGFEVVYGTDNIPTISRIFENTPASEADLKAGDKILKVNNEDVTKKTLEELVSKIKGIKNKKVNLVLERDGKRITKNIITREVDIPSVISSIFETNGKKIGYINISLFALNTDKQFVKALTDLEENKKIDSLIIDVRSNLGGHLSSVTSILNEFFTKDKILYQIEKKGIVTKVYGKKDVTKDYPVVVLVDSASASASEILAAAFKEINNSTIIGNTTYGKGTVQQTIELSTGGLVKITTETWLTSLGNQINKVGVKPTIEVSLTEKYVNNSTNENDTQLQEALKILKDK